MLKKFTEIIETKLTSRERKNLIACIIIITLVFVIGLVFAELFLRPEETPQVTSQIYNEITHTYFINKSELIKFY